MGYYTRNRKIICENSYGYKLEFAYELPYFLYSYTGVHEYAGEISTSSSAFGVGVTYLGTTVNSRNITLTIAYRDDNSMQIRKNQIYNIFPLKDNGTFYFYEGDIERKIKYYVESVSETKKKGVIYETISLLCPSPYFMDIDETIATLNNWDACFEFPLEIDIDDGIEFSTKNENTSIYISNTSHIDYGLTITFFANDTVVNPKLTNTYTEEELEINYTLEVNESIVVNTYNNEKSITYIDSNGNETDITNCLVFGSKFLQATYGTNKFVPSAESGDENLDTSIAYSNYYEAV